MQVVDDANALREAVLGWYSAHGRRLRLRSLRDPYALWIGEVMSQQTQIARVESALPAFLQRFPTVVALADATAADVVRAWAGLGYNRRALAAWRAARLVVDQHDGRFPSDPAVLETLPGVGRYTARAVAATAYGVPVTALDTNTLRVLSRLVLGTDGPPEGAGRTGRTRAVLQQVADALAPSPGAAEWNHGLMDLGSLVCRPRPLCDSCPLRASCRWARRRGARGAVVPMRRRAPAARRPPEPFESTTRWLRGRLVAALRDAPDGEWVRLDGPRGRHDAVAVRAPLRDWLRKGSSSSTRRAPRVSPAETGVVTIATCRRASPSTAR